MLRLTDLIRSDVLGPTGRDWGRLADLSVHLDRPAPATLARLLVTDRGTRTWVAATAVDRDTLTSGRIRLLADPETDATGATDHLADDELLLRRDVLDTQIVDVKGRRVSRVGDVVLTVTGDAIEAVAVEVGGASILRRLGLRRRADRSREQAVAWGDLHLTSDRGHLVQCRTEAALVHHLDVPELAELVARLPSAHAVDVLASVPPERAEQALAISHPHVRSRLVRIRSTDRPAPPRWHRLRGWDRHRGPVGHPGPPASP
jgi:sporulation protein YlmC with PRC-barrel domain